MSNPIKALTTFRFISQPTKNATWLNLTTMCKLQIEYPGTARDPNSVNYGLGMVRYAALLGIISPKWSSFIDLMDNLGRMFVSFPLRKIFNKACWLSMQNLFTTFIPKSPRNFCRISKRIPWIFFQNGCAKRLETSLQDICATYLKTTSRLKTLYKRL